MHEFINVRLKAKKEELSKKQEHFEIMWHNDKHSGCFERNAINDLLVMQQLKAEIAELEFMETIARAE